MSRLKRTLFFAFSTLLLLEVISRVSFWIMPLEVNQRYSSSPASGKVSNGAGAQGELDRGQPLRVAVFGSSIAHLPNLPTPSTWPERLRMLWGAERVHVDNYAIGWNKEESLLHQMKSLTVKGKSYDLIIVNVTVEGWPHRAENYYSSHYSARWWVSSSSPSAFLALLNRWWTRRMSLEKWTGFFPEAFASREVYDRNLRQSTSVKENLVYVEPELVEKEKLRIKKFTQEISKAAEILSARVVWIPEKIAYHPDALESLTSRYVIVRKASNFDPLDPMYEDTQSVSDRFDAYAGLMKSQIDTTKFFYLDLFDLLRAKLPFEEGLFEEEYHLGEKGSNLAAEIVFRELQLRYPDLFRN